MICNENSHYQTPGAERNTTDSKNEVHSNQALISLKDNATHQLHLEHLTFYFLRYTEPSHKNKLYPIVSLTSIDKVSKKNIPIEYTGVIHIHWN